MKLFGRLFLSAVMLLPLAGLTSANPPAPSHHPQPQRHRQPHRVHRVYYRLNPNSPWVSHGTFQNQTQAILAVNFLRQLGYEVSQR